MKITSRSIFSNFRNRKQKNAMIVTHRRAGKSTEGIRYMLEQSQQCTTHKPNYAIVSPFSAHSKFMWELLKTTVNDMFGEVGVVVNETSKQLTLAGRTYRVFSADNLNSLRGLYFDGVYLDEVTHMYFPALYEILQPAVADRNGWIVGMGTPAGNNAFYDWWKSNSLGNQEWYCEKITAAASGVLTAAQLQEVRAGMTSKQYLSEFACVFDPKPYEYENVEAAKDQEINVEQWQQPDGTWGTQMIVKFPNGQILTATGNFAIKLEKE